MSDKHKVCIIGAGATGAVLINALVKDEDIGEIVCVSQKIPSNDGGVGTSDKVKFFAANAGDLEKMRELAFGCRLIINAASPDLNIKILELALSVGANYQDMAADLGLDDGKSKNPYAIEHLRFAEEFKQRGLYAVFDTGAAPGLSNLLAARAADQLGSLAELKIRLFEDLRGSTTFSAWSPAATADELRSRPILWRGGSYHLIPPFSDPEGFDFPSPVGRVTTYSIMNNESFTIPKYLQVLDMQMRSGGRDIELARKMYQGGLLAVENLPVTLHPRELKKLVDDGSIGDGRFSIHVRATGVNGGTFTAWAPLLSQKELAVRNIYSTYIAYNAGVCAAAFTLELLQGNGLAGVTPPEGLSQKIRDGVLRHMEQLGVVVKYENV